jgi:hypothetical protein
MTEQLDWATATWGKIGKDIIQLMNGKEDDEDYLKALADKAVATVKERVTEEKDKQQVALNQINRVIDDVYKRLESEAPNYWHDPKGQKHLPKWRHNIFKYLTLGRGIKPVPKPESEPTQSEIVTVRIQNQLLKEMTIEQLNLDTETQQTLEAALTQSGIPLDEFIKQAIKIYAKTITGKTRKHSEDLTTVPTDKLLNDPTYSTHPGRAEELTKRAIKAIKYYNANVATENADRWCITQSAIASLTGSRPSTVGKVLEQFKDDIESHNQTYNLDNYSNRKRGKPSIEETINLAELTPDGLD